MATCGEKLIEILESYGIEQVFGIPGVHTAELYRGLKRSRIRHITPRHEQGAGFMADGLPTSAMPRIFGDAWPSSIQQASKTATLLPIPRRRNGFLFWKRP